MLHGEERHSPVEGPHTVDDEVGGKDYSGEEAKNATGHVAKDPGGSTDDFGAIFFQLIGVDLIAERQPVQPLTEGREMFGPLGSKFPDIAIDRRKREDEENGDGQNKRCHEHYNGESPAGSPAVDPDFPHYVRRWGDHHSKQRAHVDEQQDVARRVSRPQREKDSKKEKDIGAVVLPHKSPLGAVIAVYPKGLPSGSFGGSGLRLYLQGCARWAGWASGSRTISTLLAGTDILTTLY